MHKILIVDDERPARILLAEMISYCIPDSEITLAESAFSAMEYSQKKNFDLLFVDISMPEMTGLELLEELRQSGKSPYAFLITAYRRYDYAVQGFRLGILDYIEKPLYKEKIQKAVMLYLSKIKTNVIDLKIFNGVRRVPVGDLLAIESVGRSKVKVYTTGEILQEVTSTLDQIYKLLPSNFCYIRRNCIINLHAVKHYNLKSYLREIHVGYQDKEYSFVVSRENIKNLAVRLHFDNLEKNEY